MGSIFPSFLRSRVVAAALSAGSLLPGAAAESKAVPDESTASLRLATGTPHHFRRHTGTDAMLLELQPDGRYRLLDRTHYVVRENDRGAWMQTADGDLILTSGHYLRNLEAPPFSLVPVTRDTLDRLTSLSLALKDLPTAEQETTFSIRRFRELIRNSPAGFDGYLQIDWSRRDLSQKDIRRLREAVDQARLSPAPSVVRLRPTGYRGTVFLQVLPTAQSPWGGMQVYDPKSQIEAARDPKRPLNLFTEMSGEEFARESATLLEYLFLPRPGEALPEDGKTTQGHSPDPSRDPVGALQARIPGLKALTTSTSTEIAGYYANPGPTLRADTSGEDLYLFPDSTYLYLEWADIMPPIIKSRGRWDVRGSFVTLEDDGTLTNTRWRLWTDRIYLPLAFPHETSRTITLLGFPSRYESLFAQEPGRDPSRALLNRSLERVKPLSREETENLKESLIRKHWRPGFVAGEPGAVRPEW